jgi:hypothetical protein
VPWPRERQASKRLFDRGYLDLLAGRLAPGGRLHLVTDSENLSDWIMAQAEGSAMGLSMASGPAAMDTKYERKWSAGGQEIFFHIQGAARARPAARPPGLIDMPPRLAAINPRDYRPAGRTGPTAVVFGEFLYDDAAGSGLLRAKVAEDGFVQEFHIRLTAQGGGLFKLAPALPGEILPTAGVALALDLAAAAGGPDRSGPGRAGPAVAGPGQAGRPEGPA